MSLDSTDESCKTEPVKPERKTRRTRDGSLYVHENGAWRLESAPVQIVEGPQQALPWAQFNVSFDGAFQIAGSPVFLGTGLGLRSQEEQQHGDTGRSIWDGAIALAKALEHNRWLVQGRRALEIGSGRGVVGVSAGKLGARNVVMTDLPYALDELQEAAVLNGCAEDGEKTSSCLVEAKVLDWSNPGEFFDSRQPDERFEVVLAADVIWLMELVAPLVSALHSICTRYPEMEVLIVHQTRAANVEHTFLESMKDTGFEMPWQLPGSTAGDPNPKSTDTVLVDGEQRHVTWHPDFVPDHRVSLWCFRLMKKSAE